MHMVPNIPMPRSPLAVVGETLASVHYELVRTQDELVRSMVKIYPTPTGYQWCV